MPCSTPFQPHRRCATDVPGAASGWDGLGLDDWVEVTVACTILVVLSVYSADEKDKKEATAVSATNVQPNTAIPNVAIRSRGLKCRRSGFFRRHARQRQNLARCR
jgi:hypothetical protein